MPPASTKRTSGCQYPWTSCIMQIPYILQISSFPSQHRIQGTGHTMRQYSSRPLLDIMQYAEFALKSYTGHIVLHLRASTFNSSLKRGKVYKVYPSNGKLASVVTISELCVDSVTLNGR